MIEGAQAVHGPGEPRYRHLFENTPICIVVADLRTTPATIVDANRRAEAVFGYSAGQMVGMAAADLVADDARPAVEAMADRARRGEAATLETTNRRRDGSAFPVRIIATVDPTDPGLLIATIEDVTSEVQRRSEAEAIDGERRRIAHEVHDGLAHTMGALRMKLALWRHRADAAPAQMHAALDEMQAQLTGAIEDIRRAIVALRPVDLDEAGFFPALATLVDDFREGHQLAVTLDVSGPRDALPAAYELPLFRVIQEGLSNVAEHARATSVGVDVRVEAAGGVVVSIRDDGRGFDTTAPRPAAGADHFGLLQMRERALGLGGRFDIRSAPGEGTELVIRLPPAESGNHDAIRQAPASR